VTHTEGRPFPSRSQLLERPTAREWIGVRFFFVPFAAGSRSNADGYALCMVLMDMPISAFGPVPAWVRVPTDPKSVNRGGL
jgi:hypothetical protein